MKLNASKIKKILVISLSNIGDVILTFPVIDILKRDFPKAGLSVIVGPRAEGLLYGNPHIDKVIVFDKRQSPMEKMKWVLSLRGEKFDLVVDLRNTAIPFLVGAQYRTPPFLGKAGNIHMKAKHLNRLKSVHDFEKESEGHFGLSIHREDERYVDNLLSPAIQAGEKFIVVAPGAANHIKRWRAAGFAEVCDRLIEEYQIQVVFVGDKNDEQTVRAVLAQMKNKAVDLSTKTDLKQLAALLKSAVLVVANDSGIMHMASYLDTPTVAIFGPTNVVKYGPWGTRSYCVKSNAFCTACEKPNCNFAHECMDYIHPQEVLNAVKAILEKK